MKDRTRSQVVVASHGRLGNQLFQFAAARALTSVDQPVVVYDLGARVADLASALKPGSIRLASALEAVRLGRLPAVRDPFRVAVAGIATRLETKGERFLRRFTTADPIWHQYSALPPMGRTPRTMLRGYFQDERYFETVRDRVVADLKAPSGVVRDHAARISTGGQPTIAVIIRAGSDYDRIGWTIPLAWYERALDELVVALGGHVSVVVFSDIALVREAFVDKIRPGISASAPTGLSAVDQLMLAAQLDHAVIAPSSFAWWAAWLGDYRSGFSRLRTVVAPDPWIVPGAGVAPLRWNRLAVDHGRSNEIGKDEKKCS